MRPALMDPEYLQQQKRWIGVVGAGGKTTSIFFLAKRYRDLGLRVLITTTTHMRLPVERPACTVKDIRERLLSDGWCMAGCEESKTGKMTALPAVVLSQAAAYADVVLYEADGSRHLPVKAFKDTEPVILPQTTDVLLVVSLRGVNNFITDVCYNVEKVCEILNKNQGDRLTRDDVDQLVRQHLLPRIRAVAGDAGISLFYT